MSVPRRRGLPDEVVTHVRGMVLAAQLRPGQKIDQGAIAAELDVSRSPVREALVILGQEGLVDVTPRRGVFVADLTPADVIDHYELFGLISGRVAAQSAVELSDTLIAELESIHARFCTAVEDEHSKLNNEFHQLINSTASRRTRWLLRQLERSIPAGFFGITPGWDKEAVAGHAAIMEAVAKRNAEGARAAMEDHLHDAGVAAAEALRLRGFWDEVE